MVKAYQQRWFAGDGAGGGDGGGDGAGDGAGAGGGDGDGGKDGAGGDEAGDRADTTRTVQDYTRTNNRRTYAPTEVIAGPPLHFSVYLSFMVWSSVFLKLMSGLVRMSRIFSW